MRYFWKAAVHWAEIAILACQCLWQELRGEEPDCPSCWKCEMMRVVVLSIGAYTLTTLLKWSVL